MRSLFRLLWMASVLIIVALVSAVTAMRFAIHRREVQVPNLRGQTPAEARFIAEQAGLEAQVERQYYSSTIPEGKILSQMPVPGTVVRRGWEVRLALSLGPQRVAIPRLIGDSDRAAAITIGQRGLNLGATATLEIPGEVSGQVIAQNPPPKATDVSAPKISLLVAEEPASQNFVMPSFVGQPLGIITSVLKNTGFAVGRVTMASPAAWSGPDNSAGSQLGAPAPNPSTQTGVPQATPAQATLPATVAPPASPWPTSLVISQDPPAGGKVAAGSTINFVVK